MDMRSRQTVINTVDVVWRLRIPRSGGGGGRALGSSAWAGGTAKERFQLAATYALENVLRGKRFYEIHCQAICMSKPLECTLYDPPRVQRLSLLLLPSCPALTTCFRLGGSVKLWGKKRDHFCPLFLQLRYLSMELLRGMLTYSWNKFSLENR